MPKKSKIKEVPKEPEVIEIPSEEVFANNMADAFLRENGLEMNLEENETIIGVLSTIPELNTRFSLWLCKLIRETSFEDVGTPKDTNLH